jgi:hypothetical protein
MSSSTIGTHSYIGPKGPSGATGSRGVTGSTGNTGPIGATGPYGVYILSSNPTNTGIILNLSDGSTSTITGNFRGATSEFLIAGVSSGDGITLYYTYSSGELQVKGLSATGSLYLTEDENFVYFNTTLAEVQSELDIANLNVDTLVYLKTNYQISSTTIGVTYDGVYNSGTLVYDDKGNTKSKLNSRSKIKFVQSRNIFDTPTYLNVDDAGLFYITTPNGIAGFTGTFNKNESVSITLIFQNEDIWYFPENVYFENGENYLTCGKSIVNLTTTTQGESWSATVAARGFDVDNDNCPITYTFGSCCYTNFDGTLGCNEYVTKDQCDRLFGTFNALQSCINSCGITGICCSNGRCLENSNPTECESFAGTFYRGITCGAYANDPQGTNFGNRLCPYYCGDYEIVSCCKDGICLGSNFTRLLCEEYLGGVGYTGSCNDVNCCEDAVGVGPCCTTAGCVELNKVQCDAAGGVFMGEDLNCSEINCDCIYSVPKGACCYSDGSCSILSFTACVSSSGSYLGDYTTCDQCPQPEETGACCKTDGTCSVITPAQCAAAGGNYKGKNTNCSTCDTGGNLGACCNDINQSCEQKTQSECEAIAGRYLGENTDCQQCGFGGGGGPDPDPCPAVEDESDCFSAQARVLTCEGVVDFNRGQDAVSSPVNNTSTTVTFLSPDTSVDSILTPGVVNYALSETNQVITGAPKIYFRQGIGVKDIFITKENFRSITPQTGVAYPNYFYNGELATDPNFPQGEDKLARICLKIKCDTGNPENFRFYLLRTHYPRHFAHNLAALNGYVDENDNPFEFINPTDRSLEENLDPTTGSIKYKISVDLVDEFAYMPSTVQLRDQLNNPLLGLKREPNRSADFDINGNALFNTIPQELTPRPEIIPGGLTTASDLTDYYLKLGLNIMGLTKGFENSTGYVKGFTTAGDIVNFNSSGSINISGTSKPFQYTTNTTSRMFVTYNYPLINTNYTVSTNISQLKVYNILETFQLLTPVSTSGDQSPFHDRMNAIIQFYYNKELLDRSNNNLYTASESEPGKINPQNNSSAVSATINSSGNIVGGIGIPVGYFNMGYTYMRASDSIFPTFPNSNTNSIRSVYKKYARTSNSFSNTFINNIEAEQSDSVPYQFYGLNYPGHPLTVDLLNPNYQARKETTGGFGPGGSTVIPAVVSANTYKTKPYDIIYDSGHIEFNPNDTNAPYKRYLSESNIGNFNTSTQIVEQDYTTERVIGYLSKAINDPYDQDSITLPYGRMKYLGDGEFVFCITIPNPKDYINYNDTGDGEAGIDIDPDKFTDRRLVAHNTLRLVLFTDIKPTENDSVNQSTRSKITLGNECHGLACGFSVPNYEPTCPLCKDYQVQNETNYVIGSGIPTLSGWGVQTIRNNPDCDEQTTSLCQFGSQDPNCSECLPCCFSPNRIDKAIITSCQDSESSCGCRGSIEYNSAQSCPTGTVSCVEVGDPCIQHRTVLNVLKNQLGGDFTCTGGGLIQYWFPLPDVFLDTAPDLVQYLPRFAIYTSQGSSTSSIRDKMCAPVNSGTDECPNEQNSICGNFCLTKNDGTKITCQQFIDQYNNNPGFEKITNIPQNLLLNLQQNQVNIPGEMFYRERPNNSCVTAFAGTVLKKLYISDTDYVCVPVDATDLTAINNLEDCVQGES